MLLLKSHAVPRCKPPFGAVSPRPNPTEQNYCSKCACKEKRWLSKPKICIPWHIIVGSSSLPHNMLAFWPSGSEVDGQQPGCSLPPILGLLLCGAKKGLLYLGSLLCKYAAGASPVLAHLGFGVMAGFRPKGANTFAQQTCFRKSCKRP